jgi:hypothetical protein
VSAGADLDSGPDVRKGRARTSAISLKTKSASRYLLDFFARIFVHVLRPPMGTISLRIQLNRIYPRKKRKDIRRQRIDEHGERPSKSSAELALFSMFCAFAERLP